MQKTLANPRIKRAIVNIVTDVDMKIVLVFEIFKPLTIQCRSLKSAPNYRDNTSK